MSIAATTTVYYHNHTLVILFDTLTSFLIHRLHRLLSHSSFFLFLFRFFWRTVWCARVHFFFAFILVRVSIAVGIAWPNRLAMCISDS